MNLSREIENLIKPIVEKLTYELKRVEWKGNILVITIDKKDGKVSVEDCAEISRLIDPVIEKANLIKGSYYLQVSSPGMEPEKGR